VRETTLASMMRKARHGVRLNEHMEHQQGAVVFQHACKMAGGGCLEATGLAQPLRPLARLAQIQETGCAGGET
jgi:hypothetical protein